MSEQNIQEGLTPEIISTIAHFVLNYRIRFNRRSDKPWYQEHKPEAPFTSQELLQFFIDINKPK